MAKADRQSQVKIIPLGGTGRVNRNLFVYETERDILIVDCGVDFPDPEHLGVDIVLPDISYLKDRTTKIRGIVVTHGHYDHYGAIPYLLEELGCPPIYSSKLVRGLIQVRLQEFNLLQGTSLHLIDPEGEPFALGNFTIIPFRVCHSVPDSLGFFIDTPVGRVAHVSDFKFDWTPVDAKPSDVAKVARLANPGVLCLLSDCLGATSEGYTKSERYIQEAFERELSKAERQVFITTVSSNISRIQQAVNTSVKFGRKISFVGRSIEQNTQIAQNLGYLKIPKGVLVKRHFLHKVPDEKLTVIIAGSYGQENSSLTRLASRELKEIFLKPGAVVVFSADPIPGVYDQVNRIIDELTRLGARVVYYEIQDDLHTSGHGSQEDLKMMAALVNPRYFVPIGGEPRHMRAYAYLIEGMGVEKGRILELKLGEGLVLTRDKVRKEKMVSLKDVLVDGLLVGDVGKTILHEREVLSQGGIFIVIVKSDKKEGLKKDAEVISKGFVYVPETKELIKQAKSIVGKITSGQDVKSWDTLSKKIERQLEGFFYRKTERHPMIVPVLVRE